MVTEPELVVTVPAVEQLELARLTEQLAERLAALRHVMGQRLAKHGRSLALALRSEAAPERCAALVNEVLSFHDCARDLLRGSR